MATQSRFKAKGQSWLLGIRTIRAVNWRDLKHNVFAQQNYHTQKQVLNDTHAVQVLASRQSSMKHTERQDVTHIVTVLHRMLFQLPLLSHEGLKLGLGSLCRRSFDPALLKKPIKQLLKGGKQTVVISAKNDRRAETTQNLTIGGSCGKSQEHIVKKVLQKLTALFPELWHQVKTGCFLGGGQTACARKGKFLFKGKNDDWLGKSKPPNSR